MIKNYTELLPSYLDGDNINMFCSLIHGLDLEIYEKIKLLSNWNKLQRPILIERVQETAGQCTIYIHINSPYPIKRVTTHGLYQNVNETYMEEEYITEKIFTRTAYEMVPPCVPDFTVKVETYEENITYEKGYPENDVLENNSHDHDGYLDIIGALLGVPRRLYKELDYNQDVESYENTYPKYFTKQYVWGRRPGDLLTEDDYYYMQRLQYFIDNYKLQPLPVVMAKVLYEFDSLSCTSMKGRLTSIPLGYVEYRDTPTMNISIDNVLYRNMDYTDMEEIINQYTPLTRPVLLSRQGITFFDFTDISSDFVNRVIVKGTTYYELDDGVTDVLTYVPCKFKLNSTTFDEFTTDETGQVERRLKGVPVGESGILVESKTEYEFTGGTDSMYMTVDNSISCDVNDWEYARRQGGSTGLYHPAFMNENDELAVGRVCLCRTPIINPNIVDLSSYYVSTTFHFVHKNSYIGLGGVNTNEDGTYKEKNVFIKIADHVTPDWNNPYQFEVDFHDGIAYFYFDGTYSGVSVDFSDETDMLYLYGYANHTITNNQTLSFIWGYVDNVSYHPVP